VSAREGCCDCDLIAAILHDMSQPLTALEVGLEISLRQDHDVTQFRSRVRTALEIAQTLHATLVGLRAFSAEDTA